MKKLFTSLLTLLFISQSFAEDASIKLLCVNDLHAAIDNMPKLAYVVDSIRSLHPDAILMAAGDTRTGNPFNDKCAVSNKPMVELMNLIGFDMSTMGNHECDGGTESLVRTINDSFFPYVVANAYPADSLKMHISPFRLFQRNGIKIGVLGLVQIGDLGIPDGLDPFDNELMMTRLTGRQMAQALTEIASTDHYGPAFVSGLKYEIKQVGANPNNLTVALFDEEWNPLDMDKTYTVAMNSYLATITPAIVDSNPENTFAVSANALMKFLEEKKTVDYNGMRRLKIQ